jgi:hypothetical protein
VAGRFITYPKTEQDWSVVFCLLHQGRLKLKGFNFWVVNERKSEACPFVHMKWPYLGCILASCMMRDWKNMCRLPKQGLLSPFWTEEYISPVARALEEGIAYVLYGPCQSYIPLWFWDCTGTARYLLHDKTQLSKYLLGPCWGEGKDATPRSRPSLQSLVRRRQNGQGHPSLDSAPDEGLRRRHPTVRLRPAPRPMCDPAHCNGPCVAAACYGPNL